MPVPLNIQYPILLKALTFDRSLRSRVGAEIVIGVVYQSGFRLSLDAKDELTDFVGGFGVQSIDSLPIRIVPIDLSESRDVGEALAQADENLLYVLPLRAVRLDRICAFARAKKILTLTGVPEYVSEGLSIGIDVKGRRPSLLINITASRDEGADLDSQLLNLARIVR